MIGSGERGASSDKVNGVGMWIDSQLIAHVAPANRNALISSERPSVMDRPGEEDGGLISIEGHAFLRAK